MDLIERYLAEVERELPGAQAADIKAELRDLLLTRVEEQEERLRHPLTREQLAALLVQFGHPLVVAGRYRKVQHLIGPEVFPFWWAGLKITLAVVAAVYLVLAIVLFGTRGADPVLVRMWPSLLTAMLLSFAVVTLVGVAMELYPSARIYQKWKPSRLPPAGRKTRSRFEIAVEIAMGVVFILWWTGAIHFRNVLPFPSFVGVELAPIWAVYHWPILGYMAFEIGANLLAFGRPDLTLVNNAVSALRHIVGVVILSGVLMAGTWVTISAPDLAPGVAETIQRNFDTGMRLGLLATVAYMAVRAAWALWILGRELRPRPAPA